MTTTEQRGWWLGLSHVVASGLAHGTIKVKRAHLSIADETFNVLARIPVTRPVSEPVRMLHHGISRLSYGSVSVLAAGIAAVSEESWLPGGSAEQATDCDDTPRA